MRRLLAVTLLTLAAMAPLACGGTEDRVGKALLKTSKETYRASFSMQFSGVTPKPVTLDGEGAFDDANQRGWMTFDMTEFGEALGVPPDVDLGEMEIRYDARAMYFRFPLLQELRPRSKPWGKVEVSELTSGAVSAFPQVDQVDPGGFMEFLRLATENVEEVGEERVRRVETTRYRMTLDLDEVLKEISAEERPRAAAALDELVAMGGEREIPLHLWIDGDDFVRRMVVTYENVDFGGGDRGDMKLDWELYDFGTEVDVDLPPPNQVGDFEDVFGVQP